MLSLLAGCGTKTDNTGANTGKKTEIKISCWGIETDPNSVIIKEAVELFNKRNTMNAIATVVFTEQEQYKTKIAADMAANEASLRLHLATRLRGSAPCSVNWS